MSSNFSQQPLPSMEPVGPGLLLVVCPPTMTTYAAAVIAHAFSSNHKRQFGLPVPKRAVTVCLSGSARFQDMVRQTVSRIAEGNESSPRFLPTAVQQALDWARPEALKHLIDAMATPEGSDGSAVIAYQDLRNDMVSAEFKAGLVRADAAAIAADATFVLIAGSEDGKVINSLADAASDVAVLRQHEQDPEFALAFDIKWLGLESLQVFGWGHSFVQIKLDAEGKCALSVMPFTGTSYQDRLICAGVHAKVPQSDIARDLGISRATVCRRSSDLKLCFPRPNSDTWYAKHVARLKVEREQEAAK